jgi:ribosomal protein S18 acetylase RimI-like enzyme
MESNSIHIRPLAESDYDALVALWVAGGLGIKPAGRESPQAFARQLAEQGEFMMAAEIRGRLAGVVLGSHDGRKGWANRVAVHPDFRRRGVGAALLHALDCKFEEHGIQVRAALVFHNNTASRALFEKCGYTRDEGVTYYSKRPGPDA